MTDIPTYDPSDDPFHDLGPWTETPSSTRVSRYRYDHATGNLQVEWKNNKNAGYVYEGVGYETARQFARASSKGKTVNRVLNGFPYRPMDPEEASAPSNPNRRGWTSRVRG